MKIIKENKDMMKTVVKMTKGCGHKEYYGCLVMRNGFNYCRKCIYEIWQKESNWKPVVNKDFIYPLYADGINYVNKQD